MDYEVKVVPHTDFYASWFQPDMYVIVTGEDGRASPRMQVCKTSDPCPYIVNGE